MVGARAVPDWGVVLGCYLLSRLLVLAATGVTDALRLSGARCGDAVPRPINGYAALARCWDTHWYLWAATEGYPRSLPPTGNGQSTLAFFPGYPGLIAAGHLLGLRPLVAAVAVSLIAGAGATLLVWQLGLSLSSPVAAVLDAPGRAAAALDVPGPDAAVATGGPARPGPAASQQAAVRAAVLFAVFPGAVVLSWGYSEALAAAAAGAALLFLQRRRWLLAGLVAALAGTVRADVWLAVSCAAGVAAWLAWRRQGDRRALLAPALAPLGGLAYVGFVWWWTGSPRTWLQTQSRGWNQHLDGGAHTLHVLGGVLTDPFATPSRMVTALAVLLLIGAVFALVSRPVPAPWLVYVGVLLAISLTSSQVGFRPRAELLLLPAFVAAGGRVSGASMAWLVPVLATAQALLLILWLGVPLISPP